MSLYVQYSWYAPRMGVDDFLAAFYQTQCLLDMAGIVQITKEDDKHRHFNRIRWVRQAGKDVTGALDRSHQFVYAEATAVSRLWWQGKREMSRRPIPYGIAIDVVWTYYAQIQDPFFGFIFGVKLRNDYFLPPSSDYRFRETWRRNAMLWNDTLHILAPLLSSYGCGNTCLWSPADYTRFASVDGIKL